MSAANRTPWLSVVGIGEDGLAGLSATARVLVDDADILIGGQRHLDFIPADNRQRLAWPSPMSELIDRIKEFRGQAVVVLASGDPLWYGVGRKLLAQIPETEMTFIPAPSAFSLAAARMGWTMAGCQLVTLHGRPLYTLSLHVHPGAYLLILARDGTTPGAVATYLTERGFGESEMTTLSHMGGQQETRLSATARTFAEQTAGQAIPDLTTIAVACVAGADARWLPRTAGLADDAFRHDGKMTKREIRALALARLMPHPGALLWDIGAGCGSVAIEWLRAADGTRAIGIEPLAERRAMAAANAATLGVPRLDIRAGKAPEALAGLPQPDAVFIGGGVSAETIAASISALGSGGRLVVHAVTLESEAVLLAAHKNHGGDLTRLAVSRAETIGAYHGWRAAMPVTQWAWVKP